MRIGVCKGKRTQEENLRRAHRGHRVRREEEPKTQVKNRTWGTRQKQIPRCARDDKVAYALPRWGRAVLDPYKDKPKSTVRVTVPRE